MKSVNKKCAVLVSNYPSDNQPNALGFVHSRVRAYIKMGINVEIYRISKNLSDYIFEGVSVHCGDKDNIKNLISNKNYDVILIHFLDKDKIEIVGERKCIIWVHGFEALSWKRRLYNLNPRFPLYIWNNTKQLFEFRKYALTHPNSKFVFVSNWMYNVTCADIGHKIENYEIIHNFIDSSIFKYQPKHPEQVKQLLLIRSFANKKYANDITIKFIEELSTKEYFDDLTFTIYGEGKFFEKLTSRIKGFKNVNIYEKFITQETISEVHKSHGVFLCPTRQDAQGVSMCEAMSSGLVPLTSLNTAIPEFVEAGEEGILCDNKNLNSFIQAYDELYRNGDLFQKMSAKASKRVQNQCSFENTVNKEIMIIQSL